MSRNISQLLAEGKVVRTIAELNNRVQYHATDCTAFVYTRADLLPTTKCRKLGTKSEI